MSIYTLIIPGKLIGLNEYISLCRTNAYAANSKKRGIERDIQILAREQLGKLRIIKPVVIKYIWVEPNTRRDKDNIAFAKKFIQDALARAGVLVDDGWKYIDGFSDDFKVDRQNPRIIVEIEEV